MRGLAGRRLGVVVAGLFAFAAAVADDKEKNKEEKLSPDKLPKAVLAAIKAQFPAAEITEAEKETEGGKVVYEVELKDKGQEYEVELLEDGTILEVEKELHDPPAAVTRAVAGKYPKARIIEVAEASKVTDKRLTPTHYEVTIETDAKKELELIVSLDGTSVKIEEDGAEKK